MKFVQVVYELKLSAFGFKLRQMDLGYNGWYTSNGEKKKGRIKDASGNKATFPVRLDGKGKPFDTGYTVEGSTPVDAPNPPPGDIVERLALAVFLNFDELPRATFRDLKLFTGATK